jgi:hypothetical protein
MKLAALQAARLRSNLTRRGFLVDAGVTACAIAIPVVAIVTTAQPIPNPPGREIKSAMSSAQHALKEQRRAAKRERTRQAKNRTGRKRSKRERDTK